MCSHLNLDVPGRYCLYLSKVGDMKSWRVIGFMGVDFGIIGFLSLF